MKTPDPVAASLCEAYWLHVCRAHPARLTETRLQLINEHEQGLD
jgi:hypothetical protein